MILSVSDDWPSVLMNGTPVKLVDTRIKNAMRIVCGAVASTEIEWLCVLSNIVPSHIMRQ